MKRDDIILAQDLCMPKDSYINQNIFAIGGSGVRKSFSLIGPNIMQASSSYVINDPSGGLYKEYGSFLEYMGYKVRCLNLINTEESFHYNPFAYIHSDVDIEKLAGALISNTTSPDHPNGEVFWDRSELILITALIAYLRNYKPEENQNFSNVIQILRAAAMDKNADSGKSELDRIFETIEQSDPESFTAKCCKTFKLGAGRTRKGILSSCAVRLQPFALESVARLTNTDDIDLDSIGDEKTALFIIMPTGEKTLNFLAAILYQQLFERMLDYCSNYAEFSQLVVDAEDQVVRCYRAGSPEESKRQEKEAQAFLERAKNGHIQKNETLGRYELVTEDGELFGYRGSQEEAEKIISLIRNGGHVTTNKERCGRGHRLPVHTMVVIDGFANIGRIPEFDQNIAKIGKYEISVMLIVRSLAQIKNLYKDDWPDIIGNCATTIYLGGGADSVFVEWFLKRMNKNAPANVKNRRRFPFALWWKRKTEMYTESQIRTLSEDECIVITGSYSSESVFIKKKYSALDHPARKLVEKLGPYSFSAQ